MAAKRHLLIGITGTPASGKSRFAKALSKAAGIEAVEINSVVASSRSLYTESAGGEKIARLKPLERRLRGLTAGKSVILVGHLAQEVNLQYGCIIIVRASIPVLARRLKGRGYRPSKVNENLTCEAVDCCGIKSQELSSNTFEVETDGEKREMIRAIISGSWRHGAGRLRRQKNKMLEFEAFIRKNRRMGL